ncbi:MAG: hypothetical protein KAI47_01810 [Deltaproteobacteria bacterium]|nr:hypothetical protein [Deltaproteobacteria bacterium]
MTILTNESQPRRHDGAPSRTAVTLSPIFLLFAATILIPSTGCFRTIITNGKPLGKHAPGLRDHWHHGALLGAVELSGPYHLDRACGGDTGNQWSQIQVSTSVANTFVGWLGGTGLIYTPQTVGVVCAAGASSQPPKPQKPIKKTSGTKPPPPKPAVFSPKDVSKLNAIKPGTVVAVFDIADPSKRFKQETLDQLTDYLAAQLAAVTNVKVIPRSQLRQRLVKERKKSYKRCYDSSCQIEMGKAVAAQKTLGTKLLRIGNTCAIASSLYNIRTETTDRAATVDTRCSADALLSAIKRLVRKLAGR